MGGEFSVSGSRRQRAVSTKRRDGDPVRVYADGRIAYWTGGVAGVGERRFERLPDRASAEHRATELRAAGKNHRRPRPSRTLDELAQFMLEDMRKAGAPEGTVRQYKSNWNTWVPAEVGSVPCSEAGIEHLSAILSGLSANKSSLGTINAVIRTLNAVIRTGQLHGWLASDDLGTPAHRRQAYKVARRRAADANRGVAVITREMCPTVEEVDAFASAMAEAYPGYGDRLVYAAFSSGLRLCEVLAVTVTDVDLKKGRVRVDKQLDRYGNWPDTALPKHGRTREAVFWSAYQWVWAGLVADAKRAGRSQLFPLHRSTTKFADRVGVFCREARIESGTTWGFHWLRHAYATWSLASPEDGGYGLDLPSVSKWLGHGRTSVTHDLYVGPAPDHEKRARTATRRLPGIRG